MWLPAAAAAAVVAIAIAGVAILANRSGGDDSDTALLNATASTQAAAGEAAPNRATISGGAAPTTAGGATATTAGAAATTTVPTAQVPAAAPAPSAVVLDSPAALAAFATQKPKTQHDVATTPPTCTGGRYVGRAVYDRNGQTVAVEVFVQEREALALDAATCAEIARAPLP